MKKVSIFILIAIMFLSITGCKKKKINLSFDFNELEIEVGDIVSVKPNVGLSSQSSYSSYQLTYLLSNDNAIVDQNGNLTAVKEGTSVLTVTANDKSKSSVTLNIVIKKPVFTISFDPCGGVLESTTVTSSDLSNFLLPVPTKENSLFIGWYEDGELIEQLENRNYHLVAKWNDVAYSIKYHASGAQMPKDIVTSFFDGSKVELPIPTKKGYNFIGWYENDELVEKLENRDYTLTAKFEKIDDGNYTINYNFTEGSWYVKTIKSRDDIYDELYLDLYSWAVANGETCSFDDYKVAILAKMNNGEDIKLINPNLLGSEDKSGSIEYFANSSKYYDKWIDFFNKIREYVFKKSSSDDVFKNSSLLSSRMYDFISWNNRGMSYFRAYLSALYASIHISADVKYEYKFGESFDLVPLVHFLNLDFLGWYDNPELSGEPVKSILATDRGDKVFYPKWEDEIKPISIDLNKVIELERYQTYQLEWDFNPIDTTDKRVEFSSSNKGVASINKESGLIEAKSDGTTIIEMKIIADTTLNIKFELEVYSPKQVDGYYETTSYVSVNDVIKLNARLIGRNTSSIVWKSNDPTIAMVDAEGNVTGLKPGYVTIVAMDKEDEDVNLEFFVTVVSSEISEELALLLDAHESNIFIRYHLNIGPVGEENYYYSDIFGSASKLLTNESLVINRDFEAAMKDKYSASYESRRMESIEFITVHYTGNMKSGSNAKANMNYFSSKDNSVSIHYTTGNDGIYSGLDEHYRAAHAGDDGSANFVDKFAWLDTNIPVLDTDQEFPVVTITSNATFAINGVDTGHKVPEESKFHRGFVTDNKWLNDMGIAVDKTGDYYKLGTSWWCYTQVSEGRICSNGGNRNSIGIEACVDKGSDLWYTWQKTAKLVADIMIRNNLDITKVKGHHFYSAKDCPQPMLENDLEIWWEFIDLVKAEYSYASKFANYTITSVSDNTTYLKDNCRVKKIPDQTTCLTYTISISNGTNAEEVKLGSMLQGKFAK